MRPRRAHGPALGAVACGHPVTAAAAVEILEEGGNAFDAAIAAGLAACVAEPVLASLGGGGFLLASHPGQGPRLFDFFAHTPLERLGSSAALYPVEVDFGTATQVFHIGPGSVATPGTVAGFFATHETLGSLPMTRLAEPGIRAAREGVVVNDFQSYIFAVVRPIYAGLPHYEHTGAGDRLYQPELAGALEAIAREGAGLFYQGDVGDALVRACRDGGGHLSRADLEGYRALERAPLIFSSAGTRIVTNPPPSAGGVLIRHALEILAGADDPLATARAFAATLAARSTLLDGHDQVSRGTTHISVIDRAGNAAAVTLSNGEGSRCLIPDTGIMLNNMLGEEDINPGGIDCWRPDIRLGSMMAPTLLLGADRQCALGTGGSNRIRSALVQVIAHLLAGMAPERAVTAPRLHLEERLLSVEPGFSAAELKALAGLGVEMARWQEKNLFFGGAHLVVRNDDGTFEAQGDPRRGGVGLVA